MDLNLKGKTAIITGASRGIGKYIALGLADEGCNLTICARSKDTLDETAGELRKMAVNVLALTLDVTAPESASRLVENTVAQFGGVDILVNNVGGNRRGTFDETTDQDWQDIIELNMMSHIRVTRGVIPHMKSQKSGAIIFISSIFGRESGGPGLSIYNTTKAGLISLAKVMAAELAPQGIRVNSVAPGSIRHPGGSWDKRCIQDPEGMAEFVKREIPLSRFGRAEEVANLVVFLASERAGLISGSCINADGCQSHSLI